MTFHFRPAGSFMVRVWYLLLFGSEGVVPKNSAIILAAFALVMPVISTSTPNNWFFNIRLTPFVWNEFSVFVYLFSVSVHILPYAQVVSIILFKKIKIFSE